MITSPIGSNRLGANYYPDVQVIDLDFHTPSILQVRETILDTSVYLLVIQVYVKQVYTSLIIETIYKVNPTVGKVLI